MNKKNKIALLSVILLIGFFLAVVFHYAMGFYGSHTYPYNTFLFSPTSSAVFSDFYPLLTAVKHLDPYETLDPGASMYFPFSYLIYFFFAQLPRLIAITLFLAIFLTTIWTFSSYYFKEIKTSSLDNLKNVFILTFLSYPMLFCFERANAECFTFVLTAFFLFFYQKEKFYLSAFFLACTVSMKGYTGFLILLFLFDQHYKAFVLALATTAGLTVGSMLLFKHNLMTQLTNLQSNIGWWTHYYALSDIALTFNPTLFSLTKWILHHFQSGASTQAMLQANIHLLKIYSIISLGLILVVIANVYFFETTLWKKVAALIISSLLFPAISFDYHLIQLYLPLYLFVNANSENSKSDLIYTILFALLLIPKNYHKFTHVFGPYGSYTSNSLLNTLLLLSLLSFMMFQNMHLTKRVSTKFTSF